MFLSPQHCGYRRQEDLGGCLAVNLTPGSVRNRVRPPLALELMCALSHACTGNKERREKQLSIWGKRIFNLSSDKDSPLSTNFRSSRLLLSQSSALTLSSPDPHNPGSARIPTSQACCQSPWFVPSKDPGDPSGIGPQQFSCPGPSNLPLAVKFACFAIGGGEPTMLFCCNGWHLCDWL